MANKKSVVISGYYGFDNLGDEAVLVSIIQALKKQDCNTEITVLSNNPQHTSETYGVLSINRWKMIDIIKTIKKTNVVISGGGSLLQDVTSSKTIPYYLAIVMIAKMFRKDVVFYSQGIGPVNKGFNKTLIKYVVNSVKHVFVREEKSQKLLITLGVKPEKISVAIDPVVGIEVNQSVADKIDVEKIKQPAVGIYLRSWKNDEHMLREMKKVVNDLDAKGYSVYALPMHYHDDLHIAKQLKAETNEKLTILEDKLSIDEFVAYTKQFHMIIGMRLHSLIIAHAVGVPMIGLSYDPKIINFMDEIGRKEYLDVETFTSEQVKDQVEKIESHFSVEKKSIAEMNRHIEPKVEEPARYIQACLEGRK